VLGLNDFISGISTYQLKKLCNKFEYFEMCTEQMFIFKCLMSDKFQVGLGCILTTPVKDVAEVLNLLQDILRLLETLYTHK